MQQGTGVCFVRPELESRTGRVRVDARVPQGIAPDLQLEGYTLPNMLFLSKAVASNRTDL